jgi:hypothetical protein
MKTPLIITFCLLAILDGCDKGQKEIEDECTPEKTICNWYENKDITVSPDAFSGGYLYMVTAGDNILFIYNHVGAQCDNIDDDEWGEHLAFVIDKDLTEFEYTDSDLISVKCFYQQYGAWVRGYMYQVKDGIISGKKTSDNTWKINASVLTTPLLQDETPRSVVFTETFKK